MWHLGWKSRESVFSSSELLILNIEVVVLRGIYLWVVSEARLGSWDRTYRLRKGLWKQLFSEHLKNMQQEQENLEELADIFLGDLAALPVSDILSPRPALAQ